MTPQEFAGKIKSKYPQYAQMDDAELTQRMVKKYPQYAPQITSPAMRQPNSALEQFDRSQIGSPQQMLGMIPGMLSRAADRAGQGMAENLGAKGVNPYVSAALGTAAAMGPDIAMSAAGPTEAPLAGEDNFLMKKGTGMFRRAMGFNKGILNQPRMRARENVELANQAAKTLLDTGKTPLSGDVYKLDDLNKSMNEQAGERIGDFLKGTSKKGTYVPVSVEEGTQATGNIKFNRGAAQITSQQPQIGSRPTERGISIPNKDIGPAETIYKAPPQLDGRKDIGFPRAPQEKGPPKEARDTIVMELRKSLFPRDRAVQEIKSLRPGYRGGLYDAENSKVDQAIKTILAHTKKNLNWEEANAIKTRLQANAAETKNAFDWKIATRFKNFLDQELENASQFLSDEPGFEQFQKDKKVFGQTSYAGHALNQRIAKQEGNLPIGLMEKPSLSLLDNPIKWLWDALAVKGIRQYGPSVAGKAMYGAGKAMQSGPSISKEFSTAQALRLLRKKQNEDPNP